MTKLMSLLSRLRARPQVRLVTGSLEGPLFAEVGPSAGRPTKRALVARPTLADARPVVLLRS